MAHTHLHGTKSARATAMVCSQLVQGCQCVSQQLHEHAPTLAVVAVDRPAAQYSALGVQHLHDCHADPFGWLGASSTCRSSQPGSEHTPAYSPSTAQSSKGAAVAALQKLAAGGLHAVSCDVERSGIQPRSSGAQPAVCVAVDSLSTLLLHHPEAEVRAL